MTGITSYGNGFITVIEEPNDDNVTVGITYLEFQKRHHSKDCNVSSCGYKSYYALLAHRCLHRPFLLSYTCKDTATVSTILTISRFF